MGGLYFYQRLLKGKKVVPLFGVLYLHVNARFINKRREMTVTGRYVGVKERGFYSVYIMNEAIRQSNSVAH